MWSTLVVSRGRCLTLHSLIALLCWWFSAPVPRPAFLLKGWTVTLVVGLMALSVAVQHKIGLIAIGFVPVVVFWILDGFYLGQERLFRALYENVRQKEEKDIDFSMDTSSHKGGKNTWVAATFSRTIILFYLALVIVMVAVIAFLVLKGDVIVAAGSVANK